MAAKRWYREEMADIESRAICSRPIGARRKAYTSEDVLNHS